MAKRDTAVQQGPPFGQSGTRFDFCARDPPSRKIGAKPCNLDTPCQVGDARCRLLIRTRIGRSSIIHFRVRFRRRRGKYAEMQQATQFRQDGASPSQPRHHMSDLSPVRPPATRLPLRTRVALVLTLGTINGALYVLSNAHPLRTPVALPTTAVDHLLGWHAWTIWPYWLLLCLAPALALGLRDRRILVATLRAYGLALALNLSIWMLWPSRIIQHALPENLDPLTTAAWRALYALDGPNNCFPSGHVTIPLVIAAGFGTQYPHARRWLWPTLLVLLPSVVSTGQHYAWDVLGGAVTAGLGLLLAGGDLRRASVMVPSSPQR